MTPDYTKQEIEPLVQRVLKRPQVKSSAALQDLLEAMWKAYPNPVQWEQANEVSRLRKILETLWLEDRTVWAEQIVLGIPNKSRGGSGYALLPQPLIPTLKPSQQIWFHLYRSIDQLRSRDESHTANSLIFVCEPLFFYSPVVRAYIRFLDVNFHDDVGLDVADQLRNRMLVHLNDRLPGIAPDTIAEVVAQLGFVPVYHYAPAGDARAAVRIRRYFRNLLRTSPNYEHTQNLSPEIRKNRHLVLIGNARTNKDIDWFQRHYSPSAQLIADGVRIGRRSFPDDIEIGGTSHVYVIVSCWRLNTDNFLFALASNHARANDRVAEALVDDEQCAPWAQALVRDRKAIPDRFQLVFKVGLVEFESKARLPELIQIIFNDTSS